MCVLPKFVAKAGYAVPCGKCFQCVKRRITDWSTRLYFEAEAAKMPPIFLTLTYSNENLTYPTTNGRYATLCKRDVQTFFKRLRKLCKRNRQICQGDIKYLCVGEYGSNNHRPHYHVLLFGVTERECLASWALNNSPIGQVYFGNVTAASIAYVCGYTLSKSASSRHVARYHLQEEFHLFSKGIGKVYTTGTTAIWHNHRVQDGEPGHFILVDGVKRPMPRYYLDKIYTPQNKQLLKLQLQAIADTKAIVIKSSKQQKDAISESDRKLRARSKHAV